MFLILFIFLGVMIIAGLVALFYVHRWSIKHQNTPIHQGKNLPTQGRFLKPYIPSNIAQQQAQASAKYKQQTLRIQRIKIALIIILFTLLLTSIGSGFYVSRTASVINNIELTNAEKSQLRTTHYDWKRVYPEQLPDLNTELATLKANGIVLVGTQKTIKDERLNNLQQYAKASWLQFAQHYQITVRWCHWGNLDQCQLNYPQRLFVVLPSYWQQHKLDTLFYAGKSVLLYGEPFQTQVLRNNAHYAIYGLQFQRFIDSSHSKLALVGDRELSLGFDAGSILDVRPLSARYRVNSKRPQAIAIDSKHYAGGELTTRLYVQTVQKGRLVWMDFSLHQADHSPTLNKKKFQHIIASILRYLHKKPYQSIAMWPEGRRFAALFVHDIQQDRRDTNSNINFPEVEAIHRFFMRHDYAITWSILSNQAQRQADLMSDLAQSGEIICAGDNNLTFNLSSSKEQHERIQRCRKALFTLTGKKVFAFHPPESKFSGYTLDAMMNTNISHFIAEQGTDVDRFVPIIMQSIPTNKTRNLISLPRLVADSTQLWQNLHADITLTKRLIMHEVDYVENVGGLYLFSFNSALINDETRFTLVKQLAHDIDQKKAYVQTATLLAQWWRLRATMMAGNTPSQKMIKQFRPVILKVNKEGNMSSHWYRP